MPACCWGTCICGATDSRTGALPDWVRPASTLLSIASVAVAGVESAVRAAITGSPNFIETPPGFELRLAVVGLSTYCLTYCLGTNFNYRLVFLVLAVPFFVSKWERTRDRASLLLASITVALLWSKWQVHYGFDYRPREVIPLLAEVFAFGTLLRLHHRPAQLLDHHDQAVFGRAGLRGDRGAAS